MELVTEKPTKYSIPEGYKRTEVGVIPEDWEVKYLEELSEMITVGIANSATHAYRTKGIVLLRNQNIKKGWLDDTELIYITEEFASRYKSKTLQAGDLVTARTGYPGSTCVIPKKYNGAQSFTTLITRPKKDLSWTPYLNHYINSERGQQFFEINKIGGGQKNVNVSTLRNMPVPLPPTLEEQRAIAEALGDVDALIAELDALIEKKQQVKKGAMQQLLTGKKRLPGFDGEWEEKKLGDICEVINGGTPSTKNSKYWDGKIPWCTPTDITSTNGKSISKTERNITEEGLKNCSASLLPKGALLLCSRATVGEIKIADCEIATNQGFKSLVCSKDTNNGFLYYLIILQKQKFIDKAFGSTFLEISKKNTQEVEFVIPKLEEQKAITQILSDMDAETQALQSKRTKYEKIKQGMMQELLTGKTRLVES